MVFQNKIFVGIKSIKHSNEKTFNKKIFDFISNQNCFLLVIQAKNIDICSNSRDSFQHLLYFIMNTQFKLPEFSILSLLIIFSAVPTFC